MSSGINIEQTIEEVDINESSTVEAVDIVVNQTIEEVNITVNESDSSVYVNIVETVEPVTVTVEETVQNVNVSVDETVETVKIEVAEGAYVPLKWLDYVFQYEPSTETAVTGGLVIQYTADTTVYRFIPEPYVYENDAFYTDFDGTTLSNLLVRRI